MARRRGQQVRCGVHEARVRQMRMPTREELMSFLWMDYVNSTPEAATVSGEEVAFAPGTPREVLDSYELWRSSMRDAGMLERSPDKRG